MTAARAGNRQAIPADALKVCPSCGQRRGTKRTGWTAITRDQQIVGYTCSRCPTWDEPIRREQTGDRVRFIAVVGAKGADGKRRQLKRRFDVLDDARAWVEETRAGGAAAARQGQVYADPSRLTVQQIADRWLAHRDREVGTPGGLREVTLTGYRSAISSANLYLGDVLARDLTAGQIEAALRALATSGGVKGRALSHRSLSFILGVLRQVFGYAVREGWVPADPAARARAPRASTTTDTKATEARARRWSPSDLARFRTEADTYADGERFAREPWISVGMRLTLCGLRRSEVLGLDWSRIDLASGTAEIAASRVSTKGGKDWAIGPVKVANSHRLVQVEEIHPGTVASLKRLWIAQGRPERGLVIRDSIGRPVDPQHYSRRFQTIAAAAEVPRLGSVHNVRHSLAVALAEAGVPYVSAASLLGHDLQTYMKFYAVTDADGAAFAAKAAGALFAV